MRRLHWLAAATLALSCTDFDRVDRNVCGNAIVEPDRLEDCDVGAITEGGDTYQCGEPGSVTQCRLLCNTDGRACPDGWACEPDIGICRENVSGRFALSSPLRVTRLRRVAATDMDRDGDVDLLTNSDVGDDGKGRLSIYTFDEDGEVESKRVDAIETRATTPIVVGPLGDAGAREAAEQSVLLPMAASTGFRALRGKTDGSLLPSLQARFTGFGDDVVFLPTINQSESGSFGFQPAFGTELGMTLSGGLVDNVHDLALEGSVVFELDPQLDGRLPAPLFDVATLRPNHPIDRRFSFAVLGVAGDSFARLYVNALAGDWPYLEIALPEGLAIAPDGGAHWGDINGDDNPDALVHADDGNTYVSYNDGMGAFTSSLDLPVPDWSTAPDPAIVGAHPIAVDLIDDDDIADFVFTDGYGIALSNPDIAFTFVEINECPQFGSSLAESYACVVAFTGEGFESEVVERWKGASVKDMNADGRADVVIAQEDANVIDVFYVDEFNLLTRHRIETPGRVRSFSVGDLDSDLVNDVMFHTEDAESHKLLLSSGRPSGGPKPPVLLFEATEIIDSIVGKFGGGEVAWRDEHGQANISTVIGEPGGERGGAFAVTPCPTDGVGSRLPLQTLMGRFDDKPGHDVAMLYRDCFVPLGGAAVDQLVLYPGRDHGAVGTPFDRAIDLSACPPGGLLSCKVTREGAHPTSLELDSTQFRSRDAILVALDVRPEEEGTRDEIVMLTPTGPASSELIVAELDPAPPGLARMQVLQRASIPARIGGSVETVGVSRGSAQLANVDGDDDDDIVVLTTDEAGARLVVIVNEDGALSAELQEVVFSAPVEGAVTAFTVLDADYDLVRDDLVIAIAGDVFIVHDAFTEGASAVRIEVPGLIDLDKSDVDDLLAGDFNGDGLHDLAVVIDDDVRILRGVPKNP